MAVENCKFHVLFAMALSALILACFCLVCEGHGRRMHIRSELNDGAAAPMHPSLVEVTHLLPYGRGGVFDAWARELALLLASNDPTAAWQVVGQAGSLALNGRIGRRTGSHPKVLMRWNNDLRETDAQLVEDTRVDKHMIGSRRSVVAALLALLSTPHNAAMAADGAAAIAEPVSTQTEKNATTDSSSNASSSTAANETEEEPRLNGTINLKKVNLTVTSRCYLDVSFDGAPVGRLEIELYGETAPKAAENFRALCTGEKGFGYAGSSFYRVVKGVAVQGGDVLGGGKGKSVFGDEFPHDNYDIRHNMQGLVSTVRGGKFGQANTSDSRFVIQPVDDGGYLDGKYEAFGKVYKGLDLVLKLDSAAVNQKNKPNANITIYAAGEIKPGETPPPEAAPPPEAGGFSSVKI